MQKKDMVIGISLMVAIVFVITLIGTASAKDTWVVMPIEDTFIYLLEDDGLSPQLDPDSYLSRTIEADYIEEPITGYRTQRDWVQVGFWTYTMEAPLNVSGHTAYLSFWYNEVDEGYDNDPDFALTIRIGDWEDYIEVNVNTNEPETVPRELSIGLDLSNVTLDDGDIIEFELRYRGYEDMEFHYRCSEYPSGLMLRTDALRFYRIKATKHSVVLLMTDHFYIDWSRQDVCCCAVIHKNALSELFDLDNYHFNPQVEIGDLSEYGINISFPALIITWEHSFDEGDFTVYVFLQYNNLSFTHVGYKPFTFSGGDDDNMIDWTWMVMGIVIIASIASIVYYKRYRTHGFEETEVIDEIEPE